MNDPAGPARKVSPRNATALVVGGPKLAADIERMIIRRHNGEAYVEQLLAILIDLGWSPPWDEPAPRDPNLDRPQFTSRQPVVKVNDNE